MSKLRLGQVDYINCLPVYHALEEGLIPLEVELVKGPPNVLNKLFLEGELEVTPLSSIEFARNSVNCYILPGISISADGRVENIMFFSRYPVTELEGKRVILTNSSATSVALLKILLEHYYDVSVQFETSDPDLGIMMEKADGALLIGDDAIIANHMVKQKGLPYYVTDLGQVWKQFTGEKMVYAVWAVRKEYALANPEKVNIISSSLLQSKQVGLSRLPAMIAKAHKKSALPLNILENYFETIKYEFDQSYRKALLTFCDYAYKSGLLDERVQLNIWGEIAG